MRSSGDDGAVSRIASTGYCTIIQETAVFVTVCAYRVRAGEEDAVVALHEDWQRRRPGGVAGFLSGELLRSARDQRLFIDIVRFESEEAAESHARDPEQQAWRRRLTNLSEREQDVLACSVEWWWTAPPNWIVQPP